MHQIRTQNKEEQEEEDQKKMHKAHWQNRFRKNNKRNTYKISNREGFVNQRYKYKNKLK
jgi:hypothetical protein